MDPSKERIKLGEILVRQNILTPLMVQRVIDISRATHRRFGQTLEDLGLLTGEELAQALAVQFGYKIVTDIGAISVQRDALNLIEVDEAINHRIFPLQIREGRLALAMADPTSYDTIATLSDSLYLQIVPFIATTREIMKAIAVHYLNKPLVEMKDSILVVNTDSRIRNDLVATLTAKGYGVREADDPEEGFRQALLQAPSLILTAKDMPFSDGFAFFTTLQGVEDTRRIPVMLLSDRPSQEEEATAFKRGFFDYIGMPVRDITLYARVDRALAAGKAYTPFR
jgi:CheY-like chemotaxis protein